MATDYSSYVTSAFLNVFRGTTFPAVPANFYIALLTTMPTKSDGTGLVEVSTVGTAYARQAVATAAGNWTAPALQGDNVSNLIQNVNAIGYAQATGSGFGTLVGVAIYDAVTAGNLWAYGTLTSNVAVGTGVTFSLPAGDLTISGK